MGARGRPSRAELSVVALRTEPEVRRPDPPADLTGDRAEVWREIVGSLPPDWISAANAPLMAAYCRHVVAARRIAGLVEVEEASVAFNLENFGRLLALQERETRALSTLSTKMRLARSAVDYRRKGPTPVGGKKPWEG